MVGKAGHLSRRSSRDGKRKKPESRSEGKWTAQDVADTLANPIYGYGIVLEPFEAVVDAVMKYDRLLAGEQHRRGEPLSLDELDERFQQLFADLVNNSICTRGPDAPAIVPKETWLKAHQVMIERIERDESI